MKKRLLEWLVCPGCGSHKLTLETTRADTRKVCTGHYESRESELPGVDLDRREEVEILDGSLQCDDCSAVYPIENGVPLMLGKGERAGPSTAHALTTFDSAYPEWEENFLDLSQPLEPPDFLGKLVLDAGCGFGRHSYFAARYGAEVVALDSSIDAVYSTARNCRELNRVHVVQGDLYNPPLRPSTFDMALCFGVLHHLDRPDDVLKALQEMLTPGGRLSIWAYGPRQGATLHVSNALRGMTSSMDAEQLTGLSRAIASGLRVFSHTPYRVLRHTPVAGRVVSHLPVHDHHKWPYEIVVADIYDRLRIPVKHWFKGEQLENWLTEHGFTDVHVTRRVGNNETFRASGLRR